MITWSPLLSLIHLVGLALAVGAATAKVVLVLRCRADHRFVPVYRRVVKVLTRQIVLGLILLTLSGTTWLVLGYPLTPKLVVKIVLVLAIWLIGPYIDRVAEPRFEKLAPELGAPASPEFVRAQAQYLTVELIATLLFYLVVVIWVCF